jgi:hypothetical protein
MVVAIMRLLILCAAALVGLVGWPADADAGASAKRVPASAVVNQFSDEELIRGFLGTVFGSETFRRGQQDADTLSEVKKFNGRVTVNIFNRAEVDHSAEVANFLRVLDASVEGLRVRLVEDPDKAEMVVFLVDRADYRRTIRGTMPEGFDTRFLESNACSAVTGGRRETGLERAFDFIVANEGSRNLRHCMIEEIIQSLGPVNDDVALRHSIFNDDSNLSGFGIFDWFVLNMLYDKRVRVGMTAEEVVGVLPAVIRDARRRLPGVLRRTALHGPRGR